MKTNSVKWHAPLFKSSNLKHFKAPPHAFCPSTRPARGHFGNGTCGAGWREKAGLESIDTQVIRIPIVYRDFDDFWESNTVLIGPQGKIISGMSTSEREKLRTDLRNRLPTASDGRIVYESFANAVKGRVRG